MGSYRAEEEVESLPVTCCGTVPLWGLSFFICKMSPSTSLVVVVVRIWCGQEWFSPGPRLMGFKTPALCPCAIFVAPPKNQEGA